VARGTAATAVRVRSELPYEVPAAGKTGTTNDGTNVWFMGFTPNLMAAVWFGMDRPVNIWENATGGADAAPVWGRFVKRVYYGDGDQAHVDSVFHARGFAMPETEGAEADASEEGAELPSLRKGYLLPIPEAWPILPGLIVRQVDNRTGLLASRWCPADSAYTEYYIPGTEPKEFCDMTGIGIFQECPQPTK
jgi:membrane carboxypeptidase/penicillin-binding protein